MISPAQGGLHIETGIFWVTCVDTEDGLTPCHVHVFIARDGLFS